MRARTYVSLPGVSRARQCTAYILFIADEERSSSFDTVVDTGVTDFIRRPIDLDELLARVRAAVRLKSGVYVRALECGPIRIELGRLEAFHERTRLRLTPTEYRLVLLLAARAGHVVPRHEMFEVVLEGWGDASNLRYHVCKLRRKLKNAGFSGSIRAATGGYSLRLVGDA